MSNVKVPKEDKFTMDQTKTESWSTGISQYFTLDPNLQIKWLSTFATELTMQFRMIAQLESAASAPNFSGATLVAILLDNLSTKL